MRILIKAISKNMRYSVVFLVLIFLKKDHSIFKLRLKKSNTDSYFINNKEKYLGDID